MRREGSKYPTSQSKNSSDRLSQCLFDPVGVELPRQIWSSKNSKDSLGKIAMLYVCHLVVIEVQSTLFMTIVSKKYYFSGYPEQLWLKIII